MEYFNKILCVTYAELTGGSDAVIKAATLRQNMSLEISSAYTVAVAKAVRHSMHGVPFLRNTRYDTWSDTVTRNSV